MIDFAQKIKDNLDELGRYLKRELARELLQQGHRATGSLIKSISHAVEFYKNALVLTIEYNDYGAVMNEGVKPNRIPFGKKGSGGKSAYIQGLYDWVFNIKKLATTEKEALGITFAIAHTHREYGMPTPKSFSFSLNGRRVGFQDYVLAEKSDEIINLIEQDIDQPVWATFDRFLTKNIAA